MQTDHYKISPTAKSCAEVRGRFTGMPYAKDVYDEMRMVSPGGIKGALVGTVKYIVFHIPSARTRIASLMEGRYYSTNAALQRLGRCGILELASGMSTRGLELGNTVPYYIESDLDEMLQVKKEITRRIRERRNEPCPNHHFIPINAVYEEDLDGNELEKAAPMIKPYPSNIPLAIVHEGLLTYLTNDEQVILRDNIAEFLRKHSPKGAWITPDFSSRPHADSGIAIKIGRKFVTRMTKRPLNPFESDEAVRDFLGEIGLNVEFLDNSDIVRNLSAFKLAGIEPDERTINYAKTYRAAFITL